MKTLARRKFWNRLFNVFQVGDKVKLISTHPTCRYWVEVEGRWGVITDIFNFNGRKTYEVRFRKDDIPTMLEEEDFASFDANELELME